MLAIYKGQMKTSSHLKRSATKPSQRQKTDPARLQNPNVFMVDRRGPKTFSCAVDIRRALLVGESLDERERQG